MRLLRSSSDTIDRDKNSELVPKLESVDLVLVHCTAIKTGKDFVTIAGKK